jgi:hypothetical protein
MIELLRQFLEKSQERIFVNFNSRDFTKSFIFSALGVAGFNFNHCSTFLRPSRAQIGQELSVPDIFQVGSKDLFPRAENRLRNY